MRMRSRTILKRGKLELTLWLWLLFSVLTIKSGRYTVWVELLCAAGFIILWFIESARRRKTTAWDILYWTCLFGMVLNGIYRGNVLEDIINDFVVFVGGGIIASFSVDRLAAYLDRLPKVLARWAFFALPGFWIVYRYMEYHPGSIETARFVYNEDVRLHLFAPLILIQPLILLLFADRMRLTNFIIVSVAILESAWIGIVTLSLHVFYTLGSAIFSFMLIRKGSAVRGHKLLVVAGFTAIAIAAYVWVDRDSALGSSRDSIIHRAEGETGFAGRLAEQSDYFASATIMDVLIGRGFGGLKTTLESYELVAGPAMMHFGWAHLTMKGGIMFMVLLYWRGIKSIRRLWELGNHGLAGMLIFYFATETVHSHWTNFSSTLVYWLITGLAAGSLVCTRNSRQTLARP